VKADLLIRVNGRRGQNFRGSKATGFEQGWRNSQERIKR